MKNVYFPSNIMTRYITAAHQWMKINYGAQSKMTHVEFMKSGVIVGCPVMKVSFFITNDEMKLYVFIKCHLTSPYLTNAVARMIKLCSGTDTT